MGQPITTKDGVCFAFPDVCYTPVPPPTTEVPIPYANIGQLSQATTEAKSVLVAGKPVITSKSEIPTTTGDEAGSNGGASNGRKPPGGKVVFKTFSQTVKAEGGNVVRMFDTTEQNDGNAVGTVLGGVPTVLVGG